VGEIIQKEHGYLGTELLRDETNPQRYLTIDRWRTKEDYEAFLSKYTQEYKALDTQCEGLMESEFLLEKWDAVYQLRRHLFTRDSKI